MESLIGIVQSLLKTSIIFIIGLVIGVVMGVSGLANFIAVEIFGISLLHPLVLAFVLVGFFIIIFFKKDKIEQIKTKKKKQ